METTVTRFFERYAALFNRALKAETGMDEVATLYASAFIAASPAGVTAGHNDAALKQAMADGYERYRRMGTKEMRLRDIRVSVIDDRHCLAGLDWTATYARQGRDDVAIDFEVHYLVQILDGGPRVFGWIAGDEDALLRRHGIL